MIEEDTVYQELVLNLRAGVDVISVIKLNPPYDLLVDLDKVSLGRPMANNFEPNFTRLLNSLEGMWSNSIFNNEIAFIEDTSDINENSNQVTNGIYFY